MFEQVTDLTEHVFRLLGGGETCIHLFIMLLFLSHLSPTYLQLINCSSALVSTSLGTLCFIRREGHSNGLLSTSRNNTRFVPQKMISSCFFLQKQGCVLLQFSFPPCFYFTHLVWKNMKKHNFLNCIK